MADEQNPTVPNIVDGGTPTDQEALLAAQVDTIGENPTEEPSAAVVADPIAAAAAVVDPAVAAAAEAAAVAVTEAAAASAAAAAIPEPVAVVATIPAPQPPRDFDAAFAENQRRYDDAEIEGAEFQQQLRAIGKEEAQFTARLEIWAERQQSTEQAAAAEFSTAALAWEKANAEFMGNPLRAQQMQAAINAVATSKPGLAPAVLFAEAAKIAFEAYGFKPAAAVVPVDEKAIIAEALGKRTPGGVPPTLAGSPAAAAIEAPAGGNATFASIDAMDINSMENAIARMSPEQLEAFLREAPGANSLATNKAT